ncbi:MAG: ArsR/SmtB family transcription factor [Actinomycetota bacterium]
MDLLQAVAQPRRREILRLVWDKELSAGQIAANFDVSFAAVSQHLAILRDARLVAVREEGRRRLYRAERAALQDLRPALEKMWSSELDRLAELAENLE